MGKIGNSLVVSGIVISFLIAANSPVQTFGEEVGLVEGQWVKYKFTKVDVNSDVLESEVAFRATEGLFDMYGERVDWHKISVDSISGNEITFTKTSKIYDEETEPKTQVFDITNFSDIPFAIPIDLQKGDIVVTSHPMIGNMTVDGVKSKQVAGKTISVIELVSINEKIIGGSPTQIHVNAFYDVRTGILFDYTITMLATSEDQVLLDIQIMSETIEHFEPETGKQVEQGGGCLIATATYGSELAPQVQQLRELRDNSLLQTESGTAFMESFNEFYYSFSPIIADYERENPVFREAVKITITPMISSLSILNHVDMETDAEVLGYGISLILLNVGMYFLGPAILIMRFRK